MKKLTLILSAFLLVVSLSAQERVHAGFILLLLFLTAALGWPF